MPKRKMTSIRIPPSLKSTNAFQLLARFIREVIQPAGGKALLVGGAVRDIILKIPPKDLDVEVYGIQPEKLDASIRRFFTHTKIEAFSNFGVWQLPHLRLSFSIPRAEVQTGPKHTDLTITLLPQATPKQASKRRDLTINSMLLDPLSGELFDPYKGLHDIEKKVLRPVSSKHFADDPVRAWRVIQHMGRTAFKPTTQLTNSMRKMSGTQAFTQLSGARVRIELDALFTKAKSTGPALQYAAQTGIISHGLPELPSDSGSLNRILKKIDAAAPGKERWTILLASLPPASSAIVRRRLELPRTQAIKQQRTPRTKH